MLNTIEDNRTAIEKIFYRKSITLWQNLVCQMSNSILNTKNQFSTDDKSENEHLNISLGIQNKLVLS